MSASQSQCLSEYFEDDLFVSHLLPGHDGVLGDHVGDPAPVDPQRVRAARVVEQDLGGELSQSSVVLGCFVFDFIVFGCDGIFRRDLTMFG